jgi:hypothetical protein
VPSLQEEWVNPYYLLLLHGNFLDVGDEEQQAFIASMQRAVTQIDESIIERLLRIAWREQLAGAWFAGLKGSSQFTERIRDLLITNSGGAYAGQGYCFALARFATNSSVDYLTLYLDEYLLRLQDEWSQDWAMAALIRIDDVKRTRHAEKYLEPGGIWDHYVADKLAYGKRWDLNKIKERFGSIMQLCERSFPPG